MPDRQKSHAELAEFRAGKPGSYPDQAVYAAICLRRIRPRLSTISTAAAGLVFASPRKRKRIISAPGVAPGIRKTTPPPRRWRPTNISPTGSWKTPASRRSAANIFSCTTRHRAHRPTDTSATTRSKYLRSWARTAFVKPLTGSRGDFAQAIHDEAGARSIPRRGLALLRCDPDAADRRRQRIPDFPARRRGRLCGAQISAGSASATAAHTIARTSCRAQRRR